MSDVIWNAIIVGVIPIAVFYLQRKRDAMRRDADVAKIYQKIAHDEAVARKEMESRLNAKIRKLTNWAERLVRQLKDNDLVPVPYDEGSTG